MLDELRVRPKIPVPFLRINDLFEHHPARRPDAAAILAPGRAPLSYGRLYRHIVETGPVLRAMGIGSEDRVAVMLPNGPEMAAAVLCVASNAACVVVNPAYAADELDRYFEALRLRALIIPAGVDSPARQAALRHGIAIIDLIVPTDAQAGLFTLTSGHAAAPSQDPLGPGSVALFVLTSGTTALPKIARLTHANVCTSAYSSIASVALTEADRCLNILPLFHCHGLVAAVLTALAAGAGVVCAPGCDVERFFGWLREFQVRWYSAVPAMHQAILAQARHHPEQLENCNLRLIRSASAPLPPRIFSELERTLGATVIELYGMTETAGSPIACNPLPPRRRKPGSCGVPVEMDVAIFSDSGTLLPQGKPGHVVIRGASVTSGYDRDPVTTREAFTDGWFKTGDLGFFDDEGYLFLVGRSREMINRGGEKVTPREVDEALLEHPAVAEAVTFATPHATLGEDVAAALVLRPGFNATANEIRQFAAERLADFKVPRQVLFLRELPKGATGKVQRIGLAARLGLVSGSTEPQSFVPPRTPLENVLCGTWSDVLQRDQVGVYDDFFALGGDSLLAAHALTRIYETMQLKVEVSGLFDAPTVAEMAEHIERLIEAGQARQPSSDIVPVDRDNELPASAAQERLWKLHQSLPELPFFNILYPLRLTSPVDAAILQRALDEIVRRHEILRTTFAEEGGRLVQIVAPYSPLPLNFIDLSGLAKTRRERSGDRLVREELLYSFDLARGPLVRARLVRLARKQHLLLITLHQTLVDGWSAGVLTEELVALYDAFVLEKPSPLPALQCQFADFAAWQRRWRSNPEMIAQLAYWREQLRGPWSVATLTKSASKRGTDDLHTAEREVMLSARLVNGIKQLSHREGGTLFMGLVAGLLTLIHCRLGEDDLRVATNVANRNRPGTERLIGPVVNTVILRTRLDRDPTPREALRRVRATMLAAYAHQDLPFEDLAETLAREDGVDPVELSRVMILLHNASLRPVKGFGETLVFEEADPGMTQPLVTTTTYDVILALRESAHGLTGSCIYKPRLFSAKSVGCLLGDFRTVLERMVARPEEPISAICAALKKQR